jgi:hypothetical protein
LKRDIQLIELFLRKYRDQCGEAYQVVERPEDLERTKPAVEAIAENSRGQRLAIEHTLIESFEGQMADNQRFLAAFGRLHRNAELCVPGMLVQVAVRVGSIPTGVDWNVVGDKVYQWFGSIRLELREGGSNHVIPGLEFELPVHVEWLQAISKPPFWSSKLLILIGLDEVLKLALDISDDPGVLVVTRISPGQESFRAVLRRALENKLPKLVVTEADNRILFTPMVWANGSRLSFSHPERRTIHGPLLLCAPPSHLPLRRALDSFGIHYRLTKALANARHPNS